VQWKESMIVPICKKGDKTDCSNYRCIPLLSSTHKILPNILPSKLIPYAEEIIRDHHYGFEKNTSTAAHTFSIRQMGIQRGSASAIYRLQESLRFSWEASLA
jgi:hypothetical protein